MDRARTNRYQKIPWSLSVVSFGQNLLKKTVFRKWHHRRSNLTPLPKSAHLINPYCTISSFHRPFQATLHTSRHSLSPGLCRDVRNASCNATPSEEIAQTTTQSPTTHHDDNPGSLVPALPSSLSPADTSHHRRIVRGRQGTFPANVSRKR